MHEPASELWVDGPYTPDPDSPEPDPYCVLYHRHDMHGETADQHVRFLDAGEAGDLADQLTHMRRLLLKAAEAEAAALESLDEHDRKETLRSWGL